MTSDPKLRRTFLLLNAGTLAVLAGLLGTVTFLLRSRMHSEVLQREADVIHAVAHMEIKAASARLTKLGLPLATRDVFDAVLESSRLSGVLAVQLFDPDGKLRAALPEPLTVPNLQAAGWPLRATEPQSRFHPQGSLEQILELPPEAGAEPTPLLEVIVPVDAEGVSRALGSARYWIDGGPVSAALRRTDQRLALQAGAAFAAGGVLLLLLSWWTYRRLTAVHGELITRQEDLARANQELDFAAKTGALGAISAHLIHGLKNPLAGLEGFVAESATTDGSSRGEAQQLAMDTARRLRTLVNEVVMVLREEADGGSDYAVPMRDLLESVRSRMLSIATTAQVELTTTTENDVKVSARTANLAGLVLSNLLTNAIEATPAGRRVSVAARHAAPGQIEILVSDEGPGLPTAVRGALFRPVTSSKATGGGLGLAISHRLARHAGGELALKSSDEHGTVFTLLLPAQP